MQPAIKELDIRLLRPSALRRLRDWYVDALLAGRDLSYERAIAAIDAELAARETQSQPETNQV